jgi:hypothetical protein
MQDRRHAGGRRRSYLGGRIAFNGRRSVADCLVRDIGPGGAGIAMSATVMLPDVVEFEIGCRGLSTRARVAWRAADRLGLTFLDADLAGVGPLSSGRAVGGPPGSGQVGEVVSIAAARRLRELEAENASLRRRLADLAGEA